MVTQLSFCAEELTPAWVPVFQRSVDSHTAHHLSKRWQSLLLCHYMRNRLFWQSEPDII